MVYDHQSKSSSWTPTPRKSSFFPPSHIQTKTEAKKGSELVGNLPSKAQRDKIRRSLFGDIREMTGAKAETAPTEAKDVQNPTQESEEAASGEIQAKAETGLSQSQGYGVPSREVRNKIRRRMFGNLEPTPVQKQEEGTSPPTPLLQGEGRMDDAGGEEKGLAETEISLPIQAKLTIGEPNDKYEQEADRVARQVVDKIHSPTPETVQREEMGDEDEVRFKSEAGSGEKGEAGVGVTGVRKSPIQRLTINRAVNSAGETQEASAELEASIQGKRGSGQPLDESVREPMEGAFGADFSGVRVHTDAKSDELNQAIQAKAFTTGEDIFFREGAYEPGSRGGQELLAHELTHVVQQNGNTVRSMQTQVKEVAIDETLLVEPQLEGNAAVIQRGWFKNKRTQEIRQADSVYNLPEPEFDWDEIHQEMSYGESSQPSSFSSFREPNYPDLQFEELYNGQKVIIQALEGRQMLVVTSEGQKALLPVYMRRLAVGSIIKISDSIFFQVVEVQPEINDTFYSIINQFDQKIIAHSQLLKFMLGQSQQGEKDPFITQQEFAFSIAEEDSSAEYIPEDEDMDDEEDRYDQFDEDYDAVDQPLWEIPSSTRFATFEEAVPEPPKFLKTTSRWNFHTEQWVEENLGTATKSKQEAKKAFEKWVTYSPSSIKEILEYLMKLKQKFQLTSVSAIIADDGITIAYIASPPDYSHIKPVNSLSAANESKHPPNAFKTKKPDLVNLGSATQEKTPLGQIMSTLGLTINDINLPAKGDMQKAIRPERVHAIIYGARRMQGGRQTGTVNPAAVAHFGHHEIILLNLNDKSKWLSYYDGGHLIGDQLLPNKTYDTFVEWNLAPQEQVLNQQSYRLWMENIIASGVMDAKGKLRTTIPISMIASVYYPDDEYTVTENELAQANIIPNNSGIPTSGQNRSITIKSRIPYRWVLDAKIGDPAYTFKEKTAKPDKTKKTGNTAFPYYDYSDLTTKEISYSDRHWWKISSAMNNKKTDAISIKNQKQLHFEAYQYYPSR
ncbi:eCIS core domain-containing protein [Coleofasciculus sp. E1-EBD-02]|uniref:eCIS core domain-containing protein n=1 Tax=Coleofasciculus sp. E1-EBD-02 TaxID=3068481 RepID=UPI0032F3B39F